MPRRQDTRGIALPITLFIITLMTIALAASFARVGAERDMALGASETVGALTVAQSGLQAYIGTRASRPPDGDSVRFNVTGGYADVVARLVESDSLDDGRTMYIVRSTGYVIVPAQGATPQGKRVVAQFAQWGNAGDIRRIASYVAANGARAQDPGGGQIQVRGDCNGSGPSIGSIRAATGSSLSRGSYTPPPSGGTNGQGSGAFVADTAAVDWASIVNGGFVPDYRYINTADLGYKSHMVIGDATLNNALGRGLLIVTGDLTMSGANAQWQGIVLVGGKINFSTGTKSHFWGLVYSGLNNLLAGPPPANTQLGGAGGGTRWFFDYCPAYVDPTLARLTGLAGVSNAWVDNWASY